MTIKQLKLNAPFCLLGGKFYLKKSLKENLPENFNNYYEVFLGAGTMFLNILESEGYENKKYYLNDIDTEKINFWKLLIENPDSVLNEIKKINDFFKTASREEYKNYLIDMNKKYFNTKDPVYYYILKKRTVLGIIKEKLHIRTDQGRRNYSIINSKNIEKLIDRLSKIKDNITFYNLPYDKFLDTIKPASNDFIYLDPPYIGSSKNKTFKDWSNDNDYDVIDKVIIKNTQILISNENDNDYKNYLLKHGFKINLINAPRVKRIIDKVNFNDLVIKEIICKNY